jgi:hypothetical protein
MTADQILKAGGRRCGAGLITKKPLHDSTRMLKASRFLHVVTIYVKRALWDGSQWRWLTENDQQRAAQ